MRANKLLEKIEEEARFDNEKYLEDLYGDDEK